jgi:hypothetical protein
MAGYKPTLLGEAFPACAMSEMAPQAVKVIASPTAADRGDMIDQ